MSFMIKNYQKALDALTGVVRSSSSDRAIQGVARGLQEQGPSLCSTGSSEGVSRVFAELCARPRSAGFNIVGKSCPGFENLTKTGSLFGRPSSAEPRYRKREYSTKRTDQNPPNVLNDNDSDVGSTPSNKGSWFDLYNRPHSAEQVIKKRISVARGNVNERTGSWYDFTRPHSAGSVLINQQLLHKVNIDKVQRSGTWFDPTKKIGTKVSLESNRKQIQKQKGTWFKVADTLTTQGAWFDVAEATTSKKNTSTKPQPLCGRITYRPPRVVLDETKPNVTENKGYYFSVNHSEENKKLEQFVSEKRITDKTNLCLSTSSKFRIEKKTTSSPGKYTESCEKKLLPITKRNIPISIDNQVKTPQINKLTNPNDKLVDTTESKKEEEAKPWLTSLVETIYNLTKNKKNITPSDSWYGKLFGRKNRKLSTEKLINAKRSAKNALSHLKALIMKTTQKRKSIDCMETVLAMSKKSCTALNLFKNYRENKIRSTILESELERKRRRLRLLRCQVEQFGKMKTYDPSSKKEIDRIMKCYEDKLRNDMLVYEVIKAKLGLSHLRMERLAKKEEQKIIVPTVAAKPCPPYETSLTVYKKPATALDIYKPKTKKAEPWLSAVHSTVFSELCRWELRRKRRLQELTYQLLTCERIADRITIPTQRERLESIMKSYRDTLKMDIKDHDVIRTKSGLIRLRRDYLDKDKILEPVSSEYAPNLSITVGDPITINVKFSKRGLKLPLGNEFHNKNLPLSRMLETNPEQVKVSNMAFLPKKRKVNRKRRKPLITIKPVAVETAQKKDNVKSEKNGPDKDQTD